MSKLRLSYENGLRFRSFNGESMLTLAAARRRLRAELHVRGLEVPRRSAFSSRMTPCMRTIARRFQPQAVIDVGVAWGTPGLLRAFPTARFLLVEPLAEFAPAMNAICKRHYATYVAAAAGAHPGYVDIRVAPDLSSSSALSPSSDRSGSIRTVPLATLDSIVEKHGFRGPYVLKLDVQGSELNVLEGASHVLDATEVSGP